MPYAAPACFILEPLPDSLAIRLREPCKRQEVILGMDAGLSIELPSPRRGSHIFLAFKSCS